MAVVNFGPTVLEQQAWSSYWLFPTMESWIIMHFGLVLHLFACVSHDPWRPTISVAQTHHTYAGQPAALLPYCLPSLQSWPRTPHCRGLFLFIMGGFPPLVLLLFASTSSFHHWPLLYFLFVRRTSGHPKGSLVNPLNYSGLKGVVETAQSGGNGSHVWMSEVSLYGHRVLLDQSEVLYITICSIGRWLCPCFIYFWA